MSFAPLTEMTEPPDLMEAVDGSTEWCRLEPKWLRVTYTFMIETTETQDFIEAADSSTELCRLEPKWLRVTYTFMIETLESKNWMEAAGINKMLGPVTKWLRDTYASVTEMIEKKKSTEAAKESSAIHSGKIVSNEMWKWYLNILRASLHFFLGRLQ